MCTSRRPGKKTIRQVIYNQGTPAPGTYNQTTQKSEEKNKKSESLGVEIRKRKTRNQNLQDQKSEKNEKSAYLKSDLRLLEYSTAK